MEEKKKKKFTAKTLLGSLSYDSRLTSARRTVCGRGKGESAGPGPVGTGRGPTAGRVHPRPRHRSPGRCAWRHALRPWRSRRVGRKHHRRGVGGPGEGLLCGEGRLARRRGVGVEGERRVGVAAAAAVAAGAGTHPPPVLGCNQAPGVELRAQGAVHRLQRRHRGLGVGIGDECKLWGVGWVEGGRVVVKRGGGGLRGGGGGGAGRKEEARGRRAVSANAGCRPGLSRVEAMPRDQRPDPKAHPRLRLAVARLHLAKTAQGRSVNTALLQRSRQPCWLGRPARLLRVPAGQAPATQPAGKRAGQAPPRRRSGTLSNNAPGKEGTHGLVRHPRV